MKDQQARTMDISGKSDSLSSPDSVCPEISGEIGIPLEPTVLDIRSLLEQVDDPCFIHEFGTGRFLEANQRGCELLGYSRSEILKLTVADVEKTYDPEFARAGWRKVAAGVPVHAEGIALRKDGTTVPVEVRVGLFTFGAARMAFAVLRDSSGRKAREEALKTEHERLLWVLERLPAFTCLKDPDQTIRFVNKRFRELFGDPDGRPCHEFFHGLDHKCSPCPTGRVFETGIPEHWEWNAPDGRVFEIDNIPFTRSNGPMQVLEFGIEVTERKQLWEALMKSNEELEAKIHTRSEELRLKAADLEETNAALRFLLRQRDLDREELEQSVLSNLQNRIFPYIERLRETHTNQEQAAILDRLDLSLREMTSPFVRKLSAPLLCMTPTEIRVCDLVREGNGTKEIAEILHLSEKAVHFHRQNIRAKLGIKGRKADLRAHLLALQ